MILYGASLSPFVRKTLAFAAEKGIALDNRFVAPGADDAEFRKASPFGKIPAFRDGDFTVSDSTAIITYLDSMGGGPDLIPTEPRARATTIWFEEFADTILAPAATPPFANRVVRPLLTGQPSDEEAVKTALEVQLPPVLAYLEGVLPASGHLVEDRLTLADLAVASPFVNLDHAGCAVDAGAYPKLAAFVAAIHERPSYADVIAGERAFLKR